MKYISLSSFLITENIQKSNSSIIFIIEKNGNKFQVNQQENGEIIYDVIINDKLYNS